MQVIPQLTGFGNVGIRESNVFGQAKELSLQLGLSTRRNSIDLSYTDPYFLNSDVAAGIDLLILEEIIRYIVVINIILLVLN